MCSTQHHDASRVPAEIRATIANLETWRDGITKLLERNSLYLPDEAARLLSDASRHYDKAITEAHTAVVVLTARADAEHADALARAIVV